MTIKKPDALKQARGPKSAPAPSDPEFPAWCKALPLTAAIASGCTGAQLRPEPFECPPGARQAMEKELGWDWRDRFIIKVDDRGPDDDFHFFSPGSVVGVVTQAMEGSEEERKAPPGTRFFGKVYVVKEEGQDGKPGEIIAVYDRVKLPNHEELPVCFVLGGNRYLRVEEFKGDTAKALNFGGGQVVYRWP